LTLPMSEQHPTRVGLRIAELRKIHGFTQQALAARANVSYSLLRKVERGERPASPSFIAAIARALGVSVLDITEQPYGARDAHPTSEQAGVPALRQALVEGDDPELDTSLRTLDDLRAAVAEIKEFDRRTRHAEVVRALPDVLRHLHRTVLDLPSSECLGAHDVLAAAYSYAVVALYRLSHLDLSHLADERARMAAARGDDPLRAAVAEWNHSLNSDLAADHLTAARSLAVNGQDEANFYGTKFGLANVSIHDVAVPVELADGTTAVARAADVTLPANTAPSRIGHYWIDLARAWLLHGDRRRALDSLQQARLIAPQLTRYHPQVRETVHTLASQDARSTGSLPHFAAWCGIRL
jgi:transcriptional regulator with XRE-family HTH domain